MPRHLVVGGAGYVGSHLAAELLARGEDVTVFDDLSTGHEAAVLPGARLVRASLADQDAVDAILDDGPWHTVYHFAALSLVGHSMRDPLRYLRRNIGEGLTLIDACVRHGVTRFVLSSTAALFGSAGSDPIDEATPIDPGSPYGESKWALERALKWASRIHGLRYAALRYFNAAGADASGRLGEDHTPETHLIPLAIDAMLGRRPPLTVFGTDYATPDGTAIRDYVHVADLATAHLAALAQLDAGRDAVFNLGTGTGHSVRAVIDAVARVSGRPVPHTLGPRRAGDPPVLVASSASIHQATGWTPRFRSLDEIVATALVWREAHPHGYEDAMSDAGTT
jgi:UDP-glucose 4-epimerase